LFKKGAHRETPAGFELSRKELDAETGFYYYGARYLNPKTSMWISADPAKGEYVPRAPADDEARKHNERLPGMGGVFNYVNFHVYHYAGNNPVKYIDPNGERILPHGARSLMTDSSATLLLGNSTNEYFYLEGCYVTALTNVRYAVLSGRRPMHASSILRAETANALSFLFAANSGNLLFSAMDSLFGKGSWFRYTKSQHGADGLGRILDFYERSSQDVMIVGVFDLSEATEGVTNHMAGIRGLPDKDGYFSNVNIVPSSSNDNTRLGNEQTRKAYSLKNLKEIRVIYIDRVNYWDQ
jgi:RHS repeat-associated protein